MHMCLHVDFSTNSISNSKFVVSENRSNSSVFLIKLVRDALSVQEAGKNPCRVDLKNKKRNADSAQVYCV